MGISQSKLAQRHASLAKEIEQLSTDAQNLGVTEGVQRLALTCDQYDRLSPDMTYHLIDPGAFQREVEDTQAHKVEIWHIVRNCVSLFPLVLTWFALFFAASSYQDYLKNHPGNDGSFLIVWQDGFGGGAFTFARAALLDVCLLLLYLAFIILTYRLDRRAYTISTNFARRLQVITEEIMKVVVTDGITPLASNADVDRVANAVTRVVDSSVEMSKQIVQSAQQSIEQLVQTAQQSSQQSVQSAQQSIEQLVQSAQQTNQQTMQATQQSNQQAIQAVQQTNQQAAQATQQSIEHLVQAVQQSNQQAVQAVQQSNQEAIRAIQQTTQQIMQTAQQSSQQIVQTAQQAITDSNNRVGELFKDQVMPMMTTFNSDMVRLHRELGNYQERLNDLTVASKQLAGASSMLVANADRYVTIGQEINHQIATLNTTQQQVLSQIGMIAGNISSAAKDMSDATASMSAATASMSSSTKAVENVAMQMTGGMQLTINTMTNSVGRATQSLGQVGTELQTTTYHLQKAAVILSSLQFGSRGGLIGWFFNRQYNRRKGAGALNP